MRNNLKYELEERLAEDLSDVLVFNNPFNLAIMVVRLIQAGGVIDVYNDELGVDFSLAFQEVNGIPDIQRYDVAKDEDYSSLESVYHAVGVSNAKELVEQFKTDLAYIENYLIKGVEYLNNNDEDMGFLMSEGLTFRYGSSGANGDGTSPLRITVMLAEGEDETLYPVFRYATDNAVNISFKNDLGRVSKL